MERERGFYQVQNQPKEKKPFRLKVAELSQKVDIVQMVGGGVIMVFNPFVGAVILGGSAVTYVLAGKYKEKVIREEAAKDAGQRRALPQAA